jgi:peroxiredoxin
VVLGVNTTDQDSEQDAAAFVQQIGVTFPILLDRSGEVSRAHTSYADFQPAISSIGMASSAP